MDDFAEEGLSFEDDILLQDDPHEDSCVCAPDLTAEDYVRVTQLYYDGVVSGLADSSSPRLLWRVCGQESMSASKETSHRKGCDAGV